MKLQRLLGMGVIAVAAVALGAGPAGAVEYPPSSPTASVSSSTATPGGTVSVQSSGWQADSSVSLTLFSDPVSLGSVTADSSGAFSTTVTIPSGTAAGAHRIVLSGTDANGNAATQEIAITVTVAAGDGSLPRTGSDSPPYILFGAGLLLVGAVLAVVARRRHTASIAD